MIIGVLAEARPGETRVAATPATVVQLVKLGYEVVVEPGAGAASDFPDELVRRRRAPRSATAAGADLVFGVNAPAVEQLDALREGTTLVCLMAPALNPDLVDDLAQRRHHGAGDGRRAAHLARAVARRPQLDGQHRRLPRRDRGRARVRPVLHRPGDRRRQGAAGEGARRGRGRRRPGRHRRGRQPGRDRARDRPAPRGRRPGEVPRRRVPRRSQAADVEVSADRLRQGDVRRLQPARRRALRRAVHATSTSSSPPR